MLRNRYSAIRFFFILVLIMTSWLFWLLMIYLCESSHFVSMNFLVFCQKYRFLSILLHSILLFFILFYETFIESIYQQKYVSKLVRICTAYTALKLEYETYDDSYFFTLFILPLKLFTWRSLFIFYSVSAKFRACYITGGWGEFRIK